MLADVAVAVHPNDERYANLVGTTRLAAAALRSRDSHHRRRSRRSRVRNRRGEGDARARSPSTTRSARATSLPMPSVIGIDARITGADVGVGPYEGLDRFDARSAIVADLQARRLLVEEQPHRHSIATSDRSGDVVEPLLSLQWFVKMDAARRAGARSLPRRPRALRPGALRPHLRALAREHSRLEHLATDLVGPSTAGLVHARRSARSSPKTKKKRTRSRRRRTAPRTHARPRHARYVVLAAASGRSRSSAGRSSRRS